MKLLPMTSSGSRLPTRRGVLLLVVLSMLTLFLLLGTAYMVASTRARVTARAFNRLAMEADDARIPVSTYLDSTLLHVLRGGTATIAFAGSVTGSSPYSVSPAFESLLEDKYGRSSTLTGTATQVLFSSGTGLGAAFSLTGVTLSATTTAPELPGRVITLCPDGGEPTSHRILHASGSAPSYTLIVETPSRSAPFRLPKGPCPLVVNGREFDTQGATNEAWDGFDDNNPFLARVEPSGTAIASSVVTRASYVPSSQMAAFLSDPSTADNDNDGQKDGAFLNFGFPGIPTSSGTIDLHASVLIVDLDSRFNANAHGAPSARMYTAGSAWPAVPGLTAPLADVPMGSGYGPPEINALWMLPPSGTVNTLGLMTGGTNFSGPRLPGSRFSVSGTTPALQALQGRYGEAAGPLPVTFAGATASTGTTAGDPLPGKAGDDDILSRVTDQRSAPSYDPQKQSWSVAAAGSTGVPSQWWDGNANADWTGARVTYNSPPDLHGRMKSVALPPATSAAAPGLAYAKAEWGDGETRDDPYELVLGPGAPQNGWMADPNTSGFMPVYDNIYSIAELEAVLRPYDTDSFRLPLRLSATLGPLVEPSRLRVTTASWDTTAITGTAAANLAAWIRNSGSTATWVSGTSPITGTLGGEVSRGERFDLNRPLTSDKPASYNAIHPYYLQRQAYFKDLYTLMCAILPPTATGTATPTVQDYAQWAANVIEFRDADSSMTPFEYDTNVSDGWIADGNITTSTGETQRGLVWGAERPEILITETLAWENDTTGGMLIALHRPWNASAFANTGAAIAAEPCDGDLDTLSNGRSGRPTNVIDLGKKTGQTVGDEPNPLYDDTTANTYPIWRLRLVFDGVTQYIRFDTATPATNNAVLQGITDGDGSTKPKMASDTTFCIYSSTTVQTGSTSVKLIVTGSSRAASSLRVPGPSTAANRTARLYLDRFSNPKQAATKIDWEADPNSLVTGTSAAGYIVVDQADVTVVYTGTQGNGPQPLKGKGRDVSTPNQSLWRTKFVLTPESGTAAIPPGSTPSVYEDKAAFPSQFKASKAKWFPWPNRPFVSSAELFLVPSGNALEMLQNYQAPDPSTNFLRTIHSGPSHLILLDAVHTPTRFAGIHRTVTSDPYNDLKSAGIFAATTPVNQLSSYREPGRVNLNTVTADDVWNAAVAGPLASGTPAQAAPLEGRAAVFPAASATSMGSMGSVLALSATASLDYAADTHAALVASGTLNPASLLFTANRLANTATIRSNVFAVWITLRESIQNDPDSVKYHRAFYIVDRTIPVAHQHGKDHNVWDAVLLRRIIE